MRLGSRKGRSIADSLRITIRDDDKKDESNEILSPESPDSPSPSSSTFPLGATSTKKDDSPSPSKTTFSSEVKTSKTGSPSLTQTTFLPSSLISITSNTLLTSILQPAISTTAQASLSTSLSITAEPEPSSTAASKSQLSTTISLATTDLSHSNEIGPDRAGDRDPPGSDASSVGIALGVGAGLALLAAILFFFWKKQMRRKISARSSESDSLPPPTKPNRLTHRSDDRIINEFIEAAYVAERDPENDYQQQQNINGDGGSYIDEKRRGVEGSNVPAMPPQESGQGDTKLKHTVSSWLSRQSQQMLNPMFARASVVSSAQGLRPIDLRSISGWGDDDDRAYNGSNMPPPPLPSNPVFINNGQRAGDVPPLPRPENAILPGAVSYTPIAPAGLKLPPPPARPISVSAQTEATSVSTGTWNTWGVQQHRGKPKGFKEKLGL